MLGPWACTTVVVVVVWLGVAPLRAACVRPCKAAGLPAVFAAMFGSLMMNVLILLFVMMFVTTFWSFLDPATGLLPEAFCYWVGALLLLLAAPPALPPLPPFLGIVPWKMTSVPSPGSCSSDLLSISVSLCC